MATQPPADDSIHGDIAPISIVEEMKTSYLDYAMSVIVSRALPDVRDGLKPVHRRILYAAQEAGFVAGKPYRKSARLVGEVMGKYHPHGDQSIYDALARMTQDWSMRVPLIDGQGNFGSMDPDPPAAMRYTESRLAKVAKEKSCFAVYETGVRRRPSRVHRLLADSDSERHPRALARTRVTCTVFRLGELTSTTAIRWRRCGRCGCGRRAPRRRCSNIPRR